MFFWWTGFGQTYTSWIVGDAGDVLVMPEGGIVLAGGGGDNDDAMKWMLERANGGDVLVLRASGADGYNNYFFNELGVGVNSVETIRFDHPAAAYDPYVLGQLSKAELVFLAGGDQYTYYQYWVGTPVQDTLARLVSEKGIVIGGTSAGMAILGEAFYAPSSGSVDAAEALFDPFHPDMEVLEFGSFLHLPWLTKVITDTHYDQRARAGRHFAFLARLTAEYHDRFFGIACNEYTAVCIDEHGIARVFGQYPDYDDFAYFLQGNCQDEFLPEALAPGMPLTWDRDHAAVKVCRVPGTPAGTNAFDLNDWQSTTGGWWWNWYAIEGQFFQTPTNESDCDSPVVASYQGLDGHFIAAGPVPARDFLYIDWGQLAAGQPVEIRIASLDGKPLKVYEASASKVHLDISSLAPGIYQMQLVTDGISVAARFVKL